MSAITTKARQVYADDVFPSKPGIIDLFETVDATATAGAQQVADAIEAAQEADGDAAVAGALAGQEAAYAVLADYRQPAPGGRTYYVRKDGSDSNDGRSNSVGGAFLTIQRAVNAAYSIDAKGSVIQIMIGNGTYTDGVSIYGRLVGAFDNGDQPLRIIGNEANPASVVINPTNADAIRVGDKATLLLAGITFGAKTSGNGIFASNYAFIQHRNCRFGNTAGEMIATTSKAFVQAIGNTNIIGNAASFVHATNNSIVTFSGRTLTYEGTRVFSTYLYGLNTSVLDLSSTTIVGKGGGGITVHVNSILNVSSCVGVWTGGQPMFVSNGGLISAEDKVAAKTFYVRPDGNNQNSGFDNTADGAFFSLGAALNRLRVMPYDLVSQENDGAGSYDWRIVMAAGTFDEAVELPDTRFARVTIQGASSTTTIAKSYVSRAVRTNWTITNQQLGGSGVTCLSALDGAQLNFSNIAVVASSYIGVCDNNARMSSLGQPFSILGNLSAAFLTRFGGRVALNGSAVTIIGTPSIGRFAVAQTNASIFANGMTFTGTATGNRYDARSNGVIDTNENPAGVNFFPGNAAGNVSSGGQYV